MLKKQMKKHEELIWYVVVGICTMAISLISYFILANLVHIYYQTANILSWILAVAFAYVTNKKICI